MTKDKALQIALEALTDFDYDKRIKAIEIIKNDKRIKAIEIIKKSLKTKDEPVAWMVWGHDNVPSLTFTKPADKYVFDSLYMIPPQRTWVGLTDEEIESVYMDTMNFQQNAKALETKLKEKNT